MPDSSMRIAVIGCGEIAQKAYLPILRTFPGVEIAGLFSRTREKVDEMSKLWQIDFGTTDLLSLINRQIKAAFVLTNTLAHFEQSKQLLEAGIDVFVEKPAANSASEARELADLAKKHNRIFMVGFNRRFALLYRQAKALFAGRKIQMCILEKHRPKPYFVSLYNQFFQDTIHQIDLLRFICGDVEPIQTQFEKNSGLICGAMSTFRLPEGGIGIIQTSLQAGCWQEKLAIHGEGMSAEVNAFRDLTIRRIDHNEVYGVDRPGHWLPDLEERGFVGEIRHFLDCVRTRTKPESDGFDSATTQDLVEKMVVLAGEPAIVIPFETPH